MFLVTPDTGLIIWMTLIFGIVFFILAKWGLPAITGAVDKRNSRIDESLKKAAEAEERMRNLAKEQSDLIEQTRQEQNRLLKEASNAKEQIISQARLQAEQEAAVIIAKAQTEIAAEKENAMRDIRREVAMLSVGIAEKIVRKQLGDNEAQVAYVNHLVDEMKAVSGEENGLSDPVANSDN